MPMPTKELYSTMHFQDQNWGDSNLQFKALKIEESFLNNNHLVPHKHDYYYLIYISEGKGIHSIDFSTFDINGPMLFFLLPGQIHQIKAKNIKGNIVIFMEEFLKSSVFENEIHISPFFNRSSNKPYLKIPSTSSIGLHFDNLQSEYDNNQILKDCKIRSILEIIFIDIIRMFNKDKKQQPKQNKGIDYKRINTLEQLVQKNYISERNVNFYAEKLNITPRHLNNILKDHVNKTISELLQERILTEAKRLLLFSDLSSSEIAWKLKFSTPSYFFKFFKSKTNSTPEEFKRQNSKLPEIISDF